MKRFKKLIVFMVILAATLGYTRVALAETIDQATSITLGKSYTYDHHEGETKYFKFTVSKSGYLYFKMIEAGDDVSVYLVSSTGEEYNLLSTSYNENLGYSVGDKTRPILAGTYYIEIYDYSSKSSTFTVSFKTSFTSSDESYAETCDKRYEIIRTAKKVDPETEYKGFLTGYCYDSLKDEVDMYKVDVSAAAAFKLNIKREKYHTLNFYLVDSEGNEIDECTLCDDKTLSGNINFNLKKGTYYLKFEYCYNWNYCDDVGMCYSFKVSQFPINISKQPKTITIKSEGTAKLSVKSDSYGAKYKWYESTDGGKTWKASSKNGYNTETLSVKATEERDGLKFRCKVYVGSKYKYSKAVTLKVRPTITTQPKGKIVECDGRVKYTVESGFSDVNYQWQYSTDGGKTWKVSGATGNQTATLSVTGSANHHGYYYRCKVSSKSGAYRYSNKAVLRVKPKITLQPKSVSVKKGTNAVFTIDAKGANLKYQWQVSSDGGKSWHNTTVKGNKTTKITVKAKADQNGRRYRCVVSTGSTKTYSDAAKLTVK